MALIGKIRKNKPLLVGTLAGALALFILMLMFDNPNQNFFGASQTMVGEIEGKELDVREFNNTYEMLYRNNSNDSYTSRAMLWNFYVDEAIVKKEAEAIGIGVSQAELGSLQFSENPARLSPIISGRYVNPNTGQVDMQQLTQLKDVIMNGQIDAKIQEQQLPPDFSYRWAYQEREIVKDQLQTKMANMVSKGMYTPTWMAEMISEDQNQRVDFHYVQIPYDEIENSAVTLEDSDYKAYFEENRKMFEQDEETRKVSYVVFDVKPSAEDSAKVRKTIADLVPGFQTTENDSLYVEQNYGSIDAAYVKKDALASAIADTVFKLPLGSVYGPYLSQGTYNAVKVLDRRVIPDSVSARHILRRANDYPTLMAAQATIDSLKGLIEAGTNSFAELAQAFSEDQSNAAKGGDLNTFAQGAMVPEFNNLCFYEAEKGKVYAVVTQFGVHLLEVTEKKFVSNEESVKVAYLTQDIIPSQSTQNAVREKAVQLEEDITNIEELRTVAASKGLKVETSPSLKANDFRVGDLGPGQGSREMVQWAFGVAMNTEAPDVNDVSPKVYNFQNQGEYHVSKYVVAALESIRSAGIPSFEEVKSEMEAAVIARKKAQMISEKIAGNKDLSAIARTYAVQVDTALQVSFASPFIPKAQASEPKVVATAFRTELNQVSAPVEGGSGVFVVKPINKPAATVGNIAQARSINQQTSRVGVKGGLLPAMRKYADIKDNRSRFF